MIDCIVSVLHIWNFTELHGGDKSMNSAKPSRGDRKHHVDYFPRETIGGSTCKRLLQGMYTSVDQLELLYLGGPP